MKWYPADWLNDTMMLSAEARGCWINLLCWMWNADKRGSWTGTFEEFARVTGTPWEAAPRLIQELTKVADVTKRNADVTLENRRMIREQTHYENNTNRQARYRRNANNDRHVTAKTLDVRLLKTLDNTITPTPTPKERRSPEVRVLVDYFYLKLTYVLKEKPSSFNGGALGRLFKTALATHTQENIKGRIDAWFLSTDPFIVTAHGYSPTLFVSKFSILKGGPIHGTSSPTASRGYIGAPVIANKYAALGKNPENPKPNPDSQ